MSVSIDRKRSLWPWLLALAAFTVLAYARAMAGEFLLWDDAGLVVRNPDLRPGGWTAIARYWSPANPHEGLYAPLTYTLYFGLARVADATRGGLDPLPFHVANLACHLAAGACLFSLLRRIVRDDRAALVGVGLFWLHPIQVEPVAWIGSLNTVLSGALVLAALALHARSATTRSKGQAIVFAALGCAAFALACFAKPAAAGAPLAALAIDRWAIGTRWRPAIARAAPWALVSAMIVLAARHAQDAGLFVPPGPIGRVVVAVDTIGWYAAHVAWPIGLTIDYGRVPARVLRWGPSTFACVGLAIVAAIGVVALARRRPIALAAAAIVVAGLLPVLGLVPFQFQHYSTVADRYLYVSMAGVALAAALLTRAWPAATKVAPALLGALAIAAFAQTTHWADNDALLARGLARNPASRAVLKAYAEHAMQLGQRAGDPRVLDAAYADASDRYRTGLAARPDDPVLHDGFAALAFAAGDHATADREYAEAERLGGAPNWQSLNRWAVSLAALGRPDEAIAKVSAAASLNPTSSDTLTNWAAIELQRGNVADAASLVDRALALNPNSARAAELKRSIAR